MSPDDMRRRLEETGRSAAPPPDPAFAQALEDRLRAVHATLRADDAAQAARRSGRGVPMRAWWRSPVPVAAAMALAVAVSLGVLLRPPAGVELATAFDATVTLPDGSSVPAEAGQRLREGAVVLTGPRGRVVWEGLLLGPGEMAVVRDGRLERVAQARPLPPGDGAQPAPPPRPGVPSLPAFPQMDPRPAPSRPGGRPQAPPPPPAYREPEAADQPSPGPGADSAVVEDHAEPDADHAIGVAVKADFHASGGRAMVVWTHFDHPEFAFFVVLRAPYPSAPSWPPADRAEVVARSDDPEHRQFADGDVPYRPVYRVVALDRQGRELARSAAVTPAGADAGGKG